MKEKLKEKYLPEYYKNRLLDQLNNLRQGDMSVQNYIAKFEDLTLRCDVSECHSHIVTMLVWDLRSKIKSVMTTGSYDLNTVEEAFDLALKIDLTFKMLVNAKAQCYKCKVGVADGSRPARPDPTQPRVSGYGFGLIGFGS